MDAITSLAYDTKDEPRIDVSHWRNLYFTRTGRSYWSWFVFPTPGQCRVSSRNWFTEVGDYIAIDNDYRHRFANLWQSDDLVPFDDFLFAIPMPWCDQ